MGLVESEEVEQRVARELAGEALEPEDFSHHEQHDEAAVNVN
jgi:hypothetical protein